MKTIPPRIMNCDLILKTKSTLQNSDALSGLEFLGLRILGRCPRLTQDAPIGAKNEAFCLIKLAARYYILVLALFFMGANLSQAGEKIWQDNKITESQPFPAKVVGTAQSWVGYELLLEEIGVKSPRHCYVNIATTFPIKYVVTTKKASSKLLINAPKSTWIKVEPAILVNDFSYAAMNIYTLGKKYGHKDFLLQAIAYTKAAQKARD